MDVLAANAGAQAIVLGAQANAMMMKKAMVDAEQSAKAILDMAPKVNAPVNPPHLGKYVDVFA
jgi:hypothetical protein